LNTTWLYPFIILAGALQAFGVSMNAQLRNSLENPWLASTVSFAPIVAFFIVVFAVLPRPLPSVAGIESMAWWAPLGGLAGAVAVFAGLTLVDKIGAGPFNGLIITANLLTSLTIDHFGLLRMPIHEINSGRVLGGILMVAGIVLIARF
jgi:bacterial/archaeal transporter family-2 protein